MAEAKHIPQGGRFVLVEQSAFEQTLKRGMLKVESGVKPAKEFFEELGGGGGLSHTIEQEVAVVRIDGVMWFRPDFFEKFFFGYIDTEELLRAIGRAAMDPAAKAVMLEMNCPGGSCAGLSELRSGFERIKRESGKTFGAFANELMASAAYGLGALCDVVGMTRSAEVGSIGSRMELYDYSEAFKAEGVRAVPIQIGKFKSLGMPGLPITPEDEAYMQERLDDYFQQFLETVMQGRKLTEAQVRGFEAKVFHGPEAQANKLVDVVTSRGEFLRGLVSKAAPVGAQARKAKAMTASELREQHGAVVAEIEAAAKEAGKAEATAAAAKPATFAQLDAAFGTDSAFVTECQRADRSLAAAHAAWTDRLVKNSAEQAAKIAALETEVANLKALPAKGKATPVAGGPAAPGTDSYTDLVKVEMSKGSDRMTAELAVQQAHPKAYAAHAEKARTAMRGGKSTSDLEDDGN